MDKEAVLNIISRFRAALEGVGLRDAKIVLYGSYADGTQHEGSDIDLVIISDDFQNKGYWERIDILTDAIYELYEPIEAVAMTTEEWEKGDSLIAEIARGGEVT